MNDNEFEAEMQALLQARNEKLAKSIQNNNKNQTSNHHDNNDDNNNNDDINAISTTQKMYNKDGLLKCTEDIDNHLSFSETLVICNYQCDVIDENDDINREVNLTFNLLLLLSTLSIIYMIVMMFYSFITFYFTHLNLFLFSMHPIIIIIMNQSYLCISTINLFSYNRWNSITIH